MLLGSFQPLGTPKPAVMYRIGFQGRRVEITSVHRFLAEGAIAVGECEASLFTVRLRLRHPTKPQGESPITGASKVIMFAGAINANTVQQASCTYPDPEATVAGNVSRVSSRLANDYPTLEDPL